MNKLLIFQATLYTLIATLTPVTTMLSSSADITPRYLVCIIIGSVISGATALKAFLSTTFSDSSASDNQNPSQSALAKPIT